ncbi:NAD-dependent protein deacetylase Sirt6 [Lingula anatina]|uniref:protein acetyllysine N-acetyltransferase n=1 Tax=Lingula anatina TaxID=7574 RepID=A0A1S3K646_LINAN|nr:NAD-dependent protein deacetylase Sirt6 [Lingula anatina]XP_013417904.1 NAD-dependent protein deacetylase Sirt6 [Lingula anatina]|eukprot:XP_013417902.1 NAD-dependent protein deacetylase Sirt6 [Lingula anatina]
MAEKTSYLCSYKKCNKKETITRGGCRVEIKSFEPAQTGLKDKDALVKWGDAGDAILHEECWRSLVAQSKAAASHASAPNTMTQTEVAMVTEAKKTAEYFDSEEKVKSEAKRVAHMLRGSSHCIAFTGAGISTSAGIGDFRGKSGKWTEMDRAKVTGKGAKSKGGFRYSDLRPTYTHEALVKLMKMGILKYVISQNTDGLHRLSGIPRDGISELHGNAFHEKCEDCGTRYERPSASRLAGGVPKACEHCRINHRTGRMCERKGCQGYLMNTIINFGDNLESHVLSKAVEHAEKNDLVLCLGTTLMVSPANSLVEMGKKPVRLVICNRQPTPMDALCYEPDVANGSQVGSRVFGDCDHLMREVMRCILPQDALQEWEDGREDRMEEYNKQREC